MSEDPRDALDAYIRNCGDGRSRDWLEAALREAADPDCGTERLATLSAMAARRLGRSPCPAAATVIPTPHGPLDLAPWSPGDAGRALLILAGDERTRGDRARALYRLGDEGERISLIRALAVLADDDGLKELALDAGRTNSVDLFAALSQGNPYPASAYADHEFNHLVLKALFMELPIIPVAGLEQRLNRELSRMCEDYLDERRAAGRTVPVDIWAALVPHMSDRGRSQLATAFDDPDARHRQNAAIAVLRWHHGDAGLRDAVAALLERETDATVRETVTAHWHHAPD